MSNIATDTKKIDREELIIKKYDEFNQSKYSKDNLKEINELGINQFQKLKFPHSKHPLFTYVSTRDLTKIDFTNRYEPSQDVDPNLVSENIYQGCEQSKIVLVDGVYNEALSDLSALGDKVSLTPLDQALSDNKLKQYIIDDINKEEDAFTTLNSAFLTNGLFIDVKKEVSLEYPIQLLYISTDAKENPTSIYTRNIIQINPLANIKLIVKYIGTGDNYFINSVQDILVKEGAKVHYTQIQSDPYNNWNFSKTNVIQSKDSQFLGANASNGGKLVRHNYTAKLIESGALFDISGLSILENQEQLHRYIRVHHLAQNCLSNQRFKNIIKDQGYGSVDTTVVVHEGAELTKSDQLINNLMLSDDGKADTKPNLMIYADDVKCAHGATVGQLAEDQVFYLKTRGLTQKQATALLTRGFANSIIGSIVHQPVREELNNTLLKKLED